MSAGAQVSEALRRFRPYPKSRETGIEWMPALPAHWGVTRLKNVAAVRPSNVDKHTVDGEQAVRLCNYTDVYYNEQVSGSLDFMQASASEDEIRRFMLALGDVLVTKDSETPGDIAVPAYVAENLPGVLCGYHLAHIRPAPERLEGAYLARAFVAEGICDQFRAAAKGVTRFGLSAPSIMNALFPEPPLVEQRAIASFLGRETAKIDALVEKKERLIELLQEKRTALVTRAVTNGLDPDAPMKPSGIPWLGEIPAHWEVHHLRRVVKRFIDYRGRTPIKTDSGVPLITAGAIRDGEIDHGRCPEFISEEDYDGWMQRGWPEIGDVVFTTEAPLGEVAQVVDSNVALAQRVVLFKVNTSRMVASFLKLHFLGGFGRAEIESYASGSTALGIRADRLKRTLVPTPPLKEQRAIVETVTSALSPGVRLMGVVGEQIAKLREYRRALISAAVTGKIDVRQEAA